MGEGGGGAGQAGLKFVCSRLLPGKLLLQLFHLVLQSIVLLQNPVEGLSGGDRLPDVVLVLLLEPLILSPLHHKCKQKQDKGGEKKHGDISEH